MLWGIRCSFLEINNYVTQSHIGAHDASKKTEEKNDDIFDHDPFVAAQIVPIGRRIDNCRSHDAQGGHFDGTQQGHNQFQPGHSGRQCNWKKKAKNGWKTRLEFWYCTFFAYTILNFPHFWWATLSREIAREIQNSVNKKWTMLDL